MATGRIYDDIFLRHEPPWHPEKPERLAAICELLRNDGLWDELAAVPTPAAPPELIATVHEPDYVEHVQRLAEAGGGTLDHETIVSPDTYEAAARAIGGAVSAVEAMLAGKLHNAIGLVRPPGHHAMPNRGMGFCIFNTIAIAADYAIREHGLERVAIVDFDVHHGNGTQHVFFNRRDVLYISLHQYPLYPGTGSLAEVGIDAGYGYNINLPLPTGTCDRHIQRGLDEVILPTLVDIYKPQLVLVSAGYDGYHADPLAGWDLSAGCYHAITQYLVEAAEAAADGRLCLLLEGGYLLEALAVCVENSALALLGRPPLHSDPVPPDADSQRARDLDNRVERILEFHKARMTP